jgi:hypothetical protein
MKNYIILIFLFLIIILIYNILNGINNIEHFCKLPNINRQGSINDKNVALNYTPQAVITNSDCDKYWKDWPIESNSMLTTTEPVVMRMDQVQLPKEKIFGNNSYKYGLINFPQLARIINDTIDFNIFNNTDELLVSPLNGDKMNYKYEVDFVVMELNKKTYIDRWKEYNPSVKIEFKYDEIKSPIENINVLNLEFKKRCDLKQKELLNDKQLVVFGLIYYDIFKYRVLDIKYFDKNFNKPVYFIEIALFRESDLYLNTFSYIGYIDENNKLMIVHTEFIGINSTDNVLLAKGYDKNDIKQEIINFNFSNKSEMEKDPDAIVSLTKKYKEEYKLKNQYACFNLNYNPALKNEPLLPYYSRESCESNVDPYGRNKSYGVFDKACQKDDECPYYKMNKNYDNDFGKCVDGKCQLPINMENIGYHYYKTDKSKLPLCYNCDSSKFEAVTLLDTCCEKQFDKNLYPFLKSPDFAFKGDTVERQNYYNSKFCKRNEITNAVTCQSDI